MKVAIVGSREYPERNHVHDVIDLLAPNDIVVSGRSPGGGVDVWAENDAKARKLETLIFPVKYSAGNTWREEAMKRNWRIAKACDVLLAFWDLNSTGTTHTYAAAMSLGKPVGLITPATFYASTVNSLLDEWRDYFEGPTVT